MSVKSSTFGIVRISGKDAEKFRSQVAHGRPSKEASKAFARGKKMLRQQNALGHIEIKL